LGAIRDRIFATLGVLAIVAVSGWFAWRGWVEPDLLSFHLRATGGRSPGPRQQVATLLLEKASEVNVELSLTEVPGSVEALDELDDHRLDLALVQGGLDSKRWKNVRLVAALEVEPLQMVARGELVAKVAADPQAWLRGRTINVGEAGSGSNALAKEVLKFIGLRTGEFVERNLSHEEILLINRSEDLPDVMLTVSSPPTRAVKHLVDRGYRLVPLPFGEAFALEDPYADTAPAEPKVRIDKAFLHPTTIPAFTYSVENRVPERALPTFGARMLIVAHRKTSPEAVRRLLVTIFESEFAEIARPPLDPALLELPPEFELHPGAIAYLQRNKPLIFGDLIDFMEKASSLTTAVLGGLFFTWQWLKRSYRRRREQSFESYLLKVTAIEQQALHSELAARLDLGALVNLQAELGRLKVEAIERFTSGELEGEGLMSGFLTHANDARDYLARLILHERTQVEKGAHQRGLTPEAAWDLALGEAEPGAGS
jgi:TRAP-type uncharacterized transport system substrate-binding protein